VKDTFEKARDEYVSKADSWKAVPDSAYDEEIKQPAVVYGVYHLLRLLGIHSKINIKLYLKCILACFSNLYLHISINSMYSVNSIVINCFCAYQIV